jgi:hypothetical protein
MLWAAVEPQQDQSSISTSPICKCLNTALMERP